MVEVYPRHGQSPLESADRLLVPSDQEFGLRVAGGGGWVAADSRGPGWRPRSRRRSRPNRVGLTRPVHLPLGADANETTALLAHGMLVNTLTAIGLPSDCREGKA